MAVEPVGTTTLYLNTGLPTGGGGVGTPPPHVTLTARVLPGLKHVLLVLLPKKLWFVASTEQLALLRHSRLTTAVESGALHDELAANPAAQLPVGVPNEAKSIDLTTAPCVQLSRAVKV